MANYANLKSDIAGVIRTNNNEEITGDILQEQLLGMVDSLGAGFQYKGVATPTTAPGTPDENVFYIASTAGTYTNFGGKVVADGEVAILKYNGSWAKEVTGAATAARVTQLGQKVDEFAQGKFYGYFTNAEDLPTGEEETGFAYVGAAAPFAVYNYDGTEWIDSGVTIDRIPAGNGEDIDYNAEGLLQFADRNYDAQNPGGMGYVILRKNKTFAEQVTQQNTIYEIRYHFDLDDVSVQIPANCVLRFVGGSLGNGTIVGNGTIIWAGSYQIFAVGVAKYRGYSTSQPANVHQWGYGYARRISGSDVIISGTWGNCIVDPAWVGLDNCPENEDASLKIQRFLDLYREDVSAIVPQATYRCYNPIHIKRSVDFSYSELKICDYSDIYDDTIPLPEGALSLPSEDVGGLETPYGILQMRDTDNGHYLKNVVIDGNRANNTEAIKFGMGGLVVLYLAPNGFLFENVTIQNSNGNLVLGGSGSFDATFRNCIFKHSVEHGFYNHFNSGTVSFYDCDFVDIGDSADMISARSGAAYIWKLTMLDDTISTLSSRFVRCEFKNTTTLTYRASFDWEGMSSAVFNSCEFSGLASSYLRQTAPLMEISLVNCEGYFPTFSTLNTIITVDRHRGGKLLVDNCFKSIKDSLFESNYVGNPQSTFDGDFAEKINEPIEISNCDVLLSENLTTNAITLNFNNCRIVKDGGGISWVGSNAGTLSLTHCQVFGRGNNIHSSSSGSVIKLEDTIFSWSSPGYVFDARGNVIINNAIAINCVLFDGSKSPTITDNTNYSYRYNNSNAQILKRGNYFGLLKSLIENVSGIKNIKPGAGGGEQAYCTSYYKFPVWWSGTRWQNALGEPIAPKVGATSARPSATDVGAGYTYFDTTLGKMIVSNGSTWVNMDGSALS